MPATETLSYDRALYEYPFPWSPPVNDFYAHGSQVHVADRPTGGTHLASPSRMAEQEQEQEQHWLPTPRRGCSWAEPTKPVELTKSYDPPPPSPRNNCDYHESPPKGPTFIHTLLALSLTASSDDRLWGPEPPSSSFPLLISPRYDLA